MSEKLFEALEAEDVEVEESLERLMDDEEMYVEYLMKLKDNQNIHLLKEAVEKRDFENAKKEVHTLKGIALNLGILPLVDVCMDMLLDFRENSFDDADEQMAEVENCFNKFVKIIEENV